MTSIDSSFEKPEFGEAIFVVGMQHGDEGKGKIVDLLAQDVAAVARGNGGSNAGHTIVVESHVEGETDKTLALHQLPSGVAHPDMQNVMGHGMLVDPVKLIDEIKVVRTAGLNISPDNLAISGMAHVVLPKHKALDEARESGKDAQGSTRAGIAYAASDKALREGVRVESLATASRGELSKLAYDGLRAVNTRRNKLGLMRPTKRKDAKEQAAEFARASKNIVAYIKDTPAMLNEILENGEDILIEGAQAFGLDINHGKYPTTTSSGTTSCALIEGTGINPKRAGKVVGVAKATPSKVGGGAFVTRIEDKEVATNTRGKKGEVDGEYGATTGREREVGYLDLVLLKRAVMINGIDEIALTKFDCLQRHGKTTKIAIAYMLENQDGIVEVLKVPPTSNEDLLRCKPVYQEFPTWEDENSKEANNYLKFIEDYLGVPITMVGNGPERDQIIHR